MILKIQCDWCGRSFERDAASLKGKRHHFCCRQCLADYSSKQKNPTGYADLKDYSNISSHMTALNQELNPQRMTDTVRTKLRESRMNSGQGKTYTKRYGRHEHRVVAEEILGRKLKPGETVHHMDGNKRNNRPENIRVFRSQSEHAKFHAEMNWFLKELEKLDAEEGGDAE